MGYHLKKEIVIIGRIGGQYAKPRSSDFETLDGKKIQVFRGDIINSISPENRTPDPERMFYGYVNSCVTNHQILNWNTYGNKSPGFFKEILINNFYDLPSECFRKKLISYYEAFDEKSPFPNFDNTVYTSHEGLLLCYEECFLKKKEDRYYDLSTHLLWIGERTNSLGEAHVEFFRGICNPIGIKISNRTKLDDLIHVINLLNPENEKGKIILITRFGCELAEVCLDSLCEKIKSLNFNLLFMCDPNHGNTKLDQESKRKVRYFDDMKDEILTTERVLSRHGLFLSGIHLESSCFNVTECFGGGSVLYEKIQKELYTTYCDPRLNMLQTMELCDIVGGSFTVEEEVSQTKSEESNREECAIEDTENQINNNKESNYSLSEK